jgi:hypothetical protein
MDSLPEAATSTDATPATPRTVSGGRALAAFIVLAAILIGILLLARSNHQMDAPPDHPRSGTFSLTNAQAIAKFRQLNRLRIRAYKQRDLSLVSLAFTAQSQPARTATREIRFLLRKNVLAKPHFRTLNLKVEANDAGSVHIKQSVIVDGRFFTESGRDITAHSQPKRQTINWILTRDGSDWKISSSVVVKAVPIGVHG